MKRRTFLAACGLAGLSSVSGAGLAATAEEKKRAMSTSDKPQIWHEKIRLELTHPWTIARGTSDFKENVLVYYRRDGLTGIGEAGHLTAAGQTAQQTQAGLDQLIPLYEQANPWVYQELPEAASQVKGATGPARAAIEMALLDWLGQKIKLPLHQLFGLNPNREIYTSFSIGLDTPEVMQQKVRQAEAFPILKIKLGREDDEAIIRALRAMTNKPIRVDANEGWKDKETAIKRLAWLETQGIEFVEQPMPRQMIEETAWLKSRTRLPLVADESVLTSKDIPTVAGAFSGINIKIMKAGGILEAWRMFMVARAHGLDTMLGCMIETSVAITAATQLQGLARWLDLDGNLLLKEDPFAGAEFKAGRWLAPREPGLGIKPKSPRINKDGTSK